MPWLTLSKSSLSRILGLAPDFAIYAYISSSRAGVRCRDHPGLEGHSGPGRAGDLEFRALGVFP